MNLCDWCGQPAAAESELCPKCLDAQARVEKGELIPDLSEKRKAAGLPAKAARGLLFCAKVMLALVLGSIMVITALLGTCLTLVTFGTLVYNPGGAMLSFLGAAAAFGVSLLLAWLTWRMFEKPPQQIQRRKYEPPSIERRDR